MFCDFVEQFLPPRFLSKIADLISTQQILRTLHLSSLNGCFGSQYGVIGVSDSKSLMEWAIDESSTKRLYHRSTQLAKNAIQRW